MGVRGLTSFIRSLGILPSQGEEPGGESITSTVLDRSNYRNIAKGCTLAIDGSGLVFHIYRQTYYQHYRELMLLNDQNEQSFDDDMHLITNLIPTFLPLHKVKAMTEEILHSLVNKHDLNVKIYLDGSLSRMKQTTKDDRNQQIMSKYSHLRMLFQRNILPPSFRKDRRRGEMNSTSNLQIPPAESFLNDFPIPKLLFDEVFHAMDIFSREHEISSSSRIMKVVQCDEEADRYVALQSAADLENTTYALGSDSDYILYGFPAEIRQSMNFIGDPSVLYLPFEHLSFDSDTLVGLVITRSMIASAVGIDEDLLLEASIILGNDYTESFISDSNVKKTTNFFNDAEIDQKMRLKPVDAIEHLLVLGSEYKICSEHDLFQLSIDFTRDLYQFRHISSYPLDIDIDNNTGTDSDCDIEEDIDNGPDGIERYDFSPSILAVGTMVKGDTSKETICHQVLASFQSDNNVHDLLLSTFRFRAHYENDISDGDKGLSIRKASWRFVSAAIICEEALSLTLRERMKKGVQGYAPSTLFDMSTFLKICNDSTENPDLISEDEESCNENDGDTKVLPIDSHRDEITNVIKENRVTIIQAETGAGKSSRVPVFLLEEEDTNKVVICQPRRIASQSLADRLRSINPKLRHQIALRMGHGVREYENEQTRAWFMTTGYVVRLLANYSTFFSKKKITHFIIDEVHERSAETDILCLLCRRLLESNLNIRLVLMSATISAEMYAKYFNVSQPPIFVGARCFHINEFYLEDLSKHLNLCQREVSEINKIHEKYSSLKCRVAPNSQFLEKMHNLAVQVAINVAEIGSSVLIFVPGMSDIVAIFERVERIVKPGITYRCIAVHSDVPFEEQLTVFDSPSDGEIKIIVATNAAESSLTIPCVDHVICSGLCKQITYNSLSHRQMLKPSWISRASATQRKGRTGRVREGNLYRLYSRSNFEHDMCAFEVGEMHRMPLDSIILNLRSIMKEEGVTQILAECLEPPDLTTIERSLKSLHQSRFIDEAKEDFALTPLGNLVNILGIDLMLGAMIGLGKQLGVAAESIAVSAVLSFPQSPWLIPNALLQSQSKLNSIVSETYMSKAKFDAGLFSDPFAAVNLLWRYSRSKNRSKFCNEYSLSHPRMRRLATTYSSLKTRVASALDCESSSLDVEEPLHLMSKTKLTILRLIQVWLFHESIIELNPRSSKKFFIEGDGSCSVTLSGDAIEEIHLKSILHKKHKYELRNESNLIYTGSWKPIDSFDKGETLMTISDRFEDKILSIGIERNLGVIIIMDSQMTVVLVLEEEQEKILEVLETQSFSFDHYLVCTEARGTSQRGKYERNCGKWNSQVISEDDFGDVDDNAKIFMKFTSSLQLAKRSKSFTKLRDCAKNLQKLSINSACLRLRKGEMNLFDLFLYGGNGVISEQDISDLFDTSRENVHMNKSQNSSGKQQLKFAPDTINTNTGTDIAHCIPEGLRIVSAIASCLRKPVLRFETESDTAVEAQLKITLAQHRWKLQGTNEGAMVDGNNIPASFVPIDSDVNVRACCTNFLQLQGKMWKAEGLTLLPNGGFLSLAMKCMGQSIDDESLDEGVNFELVDQFHAEFWTDLGCNLDYSETAVTILSSIFDSLPSSDNVHSDNNLEWFEENPPDSVFMIDEDFEITTASDLEQNIDTVKSEKTNGYFCPRCGQYPFKWNNLDKHLKNVHNVRRLLKGQPGRTHEFHLNNIEAFEVSTSSLGFQAEGTRTIEVTSQQNEVTQQKNEKKGDKQNNKYFCPRCKQQPFKWKSLKEHLKTVHKERRSGDPGPQHEFHLNNIETFEASTSQEGTRTIEATAEQNEMTEQNNLKEGNKQKNKYFCPRCQQQPFKWKSLKEHLKTVHKERLSGDSGPQHEFHLNNIEPVEKSGAESIEETKGIPITENVDVTGIEEIPTTLDNRSTISSVRTLSVDVPKANISSNKECYCPSCGDKLKCKQLRKHMKVIHGEDWTGMIEPDYDFNLFGTSCVEVPSSVDSIEESETSCVDNTEAIRDLNVYNLDTITSVLDNIEASGRRNSHSIKATAARVPNLDNVKEYQCPRCGELPFKWKQLRKHLKTVHNEEWRGGPSEFNVADIKTVGNSTVDVSDQNTDGKKKKQEYFCPRCGEQPFKWKSLRGHMKSVHNESLKGDGGTNHEFNLDNIGATRKSAVAVSDQNTQDKKKKHKYFCPRCGKQPFKWKQLRDHMKSAHNESLKGDGGPKHESNLDNIKAVGK